MRVSTFVYGPAEVCVVYWYSPLLAYSSHHPFFLPPAFGDDENIGLLFRNIEEYQRDVSAVVGGETLGVVQLPPSITVRFAPLKSVLTTSATDAIEEVEEDYSTKCNKWQRRLEIISCFLSLFCLLGVILVWILQNSISIELTRNIQFSSLNPSILDSMRLWHNAVAESCASGSFDLIMTQPPWTNEKNQKFDGLSIDATIYASYINLTAVVFFLFFSQLCFRESVLLRQNVIPE